MSSPRATGPSCMSPAARAAGRDTSSGSITEARRHVRSNSRWSFRGIHGFLPTAGISRSRLDRRGAGNVWVHDLTGASRPPLKLTFDNHNLFPIWSPDSKRLLFITRGRANYLNAVAADGSSLEPETLATNGEAQVPMTWVPGTDLVLVAQARGETRQDLELFQMTGRTWRHWLQTRFDETEARVSPDGKWVAYTSDQTGQPEVWVRSFLDAGTPNRVSPDGGRDAVWSPDGRELFYRNGSRMMAAKVAPAAPTMRVESPRQLFEGGFEPGSQRAFDVGPDGRFLMVEASTRDSSASIVLVRNWVHQIRELVRPK